jgi:hypothetical protein
VSVSEDRRIAVLEAATHHRGRDVAVTLMEMLPSMTSLGTAIITLVR